MVPRYGMIAGNGRFPFLALESARKLGVPVVTIAIQEEASPELEPLARSGSGSFYWISLGGLSRLIEICKNEGVREIMMCGQVKHTKIFSSIRPDWRLFKLLASLREKNTDALIGGVAKVLADEGITLVDSTLLLKDLLAPEGVFTSRKPDSEERKQLRYGRSIAAALAGFDVGQSVVISDRACVALEAMEGTDAILRRAHQLTGGKPQLLVKSSRRRKHLLFDVPVLGSATMDVMRETNTTAAIMDAGRTLLLDRDELVAKANRYEISLIGEAPPSSEP
jgi:UDP-2,3-diacylglucosamine hydrolase